MEDGRWSEGVVGGWLLLFEERLGGRLLLLLLFEERLGGRLLLLLLFEWVVDGRMMLFDWMVLEGLLLVGWVDKFLDDITNDRMHEEFAVVERSLVVFFTFDLALSTIRVLVVVVDSNQTSESVKALMQTTDPLVGEVKMKW